MIEKFLKKPSRQTVHCLLIFTFFGVAEFSPVKIDLTNFFFTYLQILEHCDGSDLSPGQIYKLIVYSPAKHQHRHWQSK